MDTLTFLIGYHAVIFGWVFYFGYMYGRTKGKIVHNHYNSEKAYISVLAGATIQTAQGTTNHE